MAILEPFALAIGFLLSYIYDFTASYGTSIAILTVIINVIIFPLTLRQTRSTKRMQDAQSDIKRLQKQHKDNKEELNKAMANEVPNSPYGMGTRPRAYVVHETCTKLNSQLRKAWVMGF